MSSPPSSTPPISFAIEVAIAIGLAVVTGLLYANTLGVPFVFDDWQNIENNPLIRVRGWDLDALYQAAFASPSPRPIANLSFALNYSLGGLDVRGYHGFNIVVHWINGWLVYCLAIRVQRDAARVAGRPASSAPQQVAMALTAAGLFVAHPIQTQSVTYIVQRMTSLSVLFGLLSFLLFLRTRDEPPGRRQWPRLLAAFLCWVLAMATKQIAAPLPILALLYEWFFHRDLASGWIRRNAAWFAATLATLAGVSLLYLHRLPFGYENRPFDMGERVLTQLRVLWLYLGLLAYPAPSRLNLAHDFPISHTLLDPPTTLLALLGLIGLAAFSILFARRERLISYCILWFLGTLAIESSVIALELVYEHRLYLPMVMIAIAGSDLLFRLSPQRIAAASACAFALVVVLGLATVTRNEVWRDRISLWSDTVSKSPGDHRAQNNLGDALSDAGDLEAALAHLEHAVDLAPEYVRARHNLARTLQILGRPEEAAIQYRELINQTPNDALALRDLGTALEASGELNAALDAYSRSVAERPGYFEANFDLGMLLARRGEASAAAEQLSRAIKLRPTHAEAHHALGLLYAQQGRIEQALPILIRAIELDPALGAAHLHLGMLYGVLKQWDLAERHLREALKIDPENSEASAKLQQLEELRAKS